MDDKQWLAKLRAEQKRIRDIIDSASDAFIAIDEAGRIIDWNPQAEKTLGWSRDDILGKDLFTTLAPERMRHVYRDDLQRFLQIGMSEFLNKRTEQVILHQMGYELPVEVTVSTVCNEGKYTFYIFLHDISVRKNAERIQQMQLDSTRILAEAQSVQEACERVLACISEGFNWDYGVCWHVDESKYQLKPEFFHQVPSTYKKYFEVITLSPAWEDENSLPAQVLRTKKPVWIENRCSFKHLTQRDASKLIALHSTAAFPVLVEEEVVGVLEFFSHCVRPLDPHVLEVMADIGSRIGLFIQRKKADERNAAKSTFLATISHELRTPLSAVLGFAELLASNKINAEERATFVSAIRRNGEMLSAIINDILDISKAEVGKFEINRQPVALTDILRDLRALLGRQAQAKGLGLEISKVGRMPLLIETDSLRLRQLLLNIVGNAIKFTQQGKVQVQVRWEWKESTETEKTLSRLIFEVVDTGPGIRPELHQSIFSLYAQGNATATSRQGGVGLGLPLAKRLAGLLGGDVRLVESIIGKGTRFAVWIDPGAIALEEKEEEESAQEDEEERGEQPFEKAAKRAPINLQGVRILLADDAPDNLFLVTRILTRAGAQVEAAINGIEVLEKTEAQTFNVLLMDLQMPLMNGIEATKKLRSKGYTGPIIALTAHAMSEERSRCLAQGFTDYLCKPFDLKTLLERVARYSLNH